MTTPLTLRSVKGSALTHDEMDANLTSLRTTADDALAATTTLTANKAEAAALGVANTDQNMGSFTGTTIADNVSAKVALQSLETAVEAASGAAATKANASAVGISASASNMGTYTGAIIPDNQTAKQNIQSLETEFERRTLVSVKDYGAVGDDVTDDTAAFVAAAAASVPVVIPPGIYRVGGVTFTDRVTFLPGAQIRRTAGSLAFSGGIEAPIEQIFLDAVYPNVDVHNTLTPIGWVDWFGYDADAIETCHKIFRINKLGSRQYTVTRTVILDQSYREVIGYYGSAEGSGGTRIVLTGAAAVTDPVIQVGTLNTTLVASCARRLNIRGINTFRDGTINPAVTDRREDAVPGWKIAGWYEGRMDQCFDYGSPIHYRIYGTVTCTVENCGGVRPNAGAVTGHPDYYTAFVVGGYATSFGFIGANASITIKDCSTAGGVGTDRMGLFLFGYIGDSWVSKFEMSQLEYGVFVDGADAAGVPLTALTAHQDVRIHECVTDATLFNCITVQNINRGGHISLDGDNYCALNAAGDAILINACVGLVSIDSGDIIANSTLANYGVRIAGSERVTVGPAVKIKDCEIGLKAESSSELRLEPTITRASTGGAHGLELAGVGRSYVQPIIGADVAAFDYGIVSDSATNFTEISLAGINYNCFTTAAAVRKLWHNGAGVEMPGPFGNNNELLANVDKHFYEEGTATIVIQDSAGNSATMGSANVFRFERNGTSVTVSGTLDWTSTAALTAGSRLKITGLPYPAISTTNYRAPAIFGSSTSGSFNITRGEIAFGLDNSNSFLWGTKISGNNVDGNMVKADIGSSGTLYGLQVTYRAVV